MRGLPYHVDNRSCGVLWCKWLSVLIRDKNKNTLGSLYTISIVCMPPSLPFLSLPPVFVSHNTALAHVTHHWEHRAPKSRAMSVLTAKYQIIAREYSMRVCLRLPMLMCVCYSTVCVCQIAFFCSFSPPSSLSGWCYPTGRCAYLTSVTCYGQSINPHPLPQSPAHPCFSLPHLLFVNIIPLLLLLLPSPSYPLT